MRLVALRGEEPADDTVVVVRAGANGLSDETLRRSASASHAEHGFYGVSVFLAVDLPVDELCASTALCSIICAPASIRSGRTQVGRRLPLMSAASSPGWDLWVDFHRVDAAGLTHAQVRDASPGVELREGAFVVGDDDADPGVAQVIEVRNDGVVLLRALPGHADLHRALLHPQTA